MDRAQLIAALTYLVMACFVAGGSVALRYRRTLRGTAIIFYLAALALALVSIALWLAGVNS
jgi:hypothetical protein